MKRNNKKGFTIVELVIVIAVIAILAGVLIPTFAGITNKAKDSAALQEATNVLKAYVADYASTDEVVDLYIIKFEDGKATIAYKVTRGQIAEKKMETIPTIAPEVEKVTDAEGTVTTPYSPEKAGEYTLVDKTYEGDWKVYTKD
jgi:prepilin-type N-terminal cleavage/methylation domain-containing protein